MRTPNLPNLTGGGKGTGWWPSLTDKQTVMQEDQIISENLTVAKQLTWPPNSVWSLALCDALLSKAPACLLPHSWPSLQSCRA